MDNKKFYRELIYNSISIIVFGFIAYHVKDDKLNLTIFIFLFAGGIISFIGKINNRRFLKKVAEKDALNIAEINFNQWYINTLNKKRKRYWVRQKMLTPYEMFEEVFKKSETGKEILELVKKEIKNGGNAESVFKTCREIKY